MRRKLLALTTLAVLPLAGCTATMREGHPEDIPTWWRSYHGPDKELNVELSGDLDEDHEYFQTRCEQMGGRELIVTVDGSGNWKKAVCERVDY